MFSDYPGSTGGSGILIHADQEVKIDASVSSEKKEERLSALISQLKARNGDLEKQAMQHKISFAQIIASMETLLAKRSLLLVDNETVRTSFEMIGDLNGQIDQMSLSLSEEVRSYADVLSLLAETSRQLKCLDEEKGKIKKGDAYKKNYTGAHVSIDGEHIELKSVDGDGNLRENEASGISLKANVVSVAALEADGSLKKEGKLNINTKNVEISTADNKDMKYDDQGELTSAMHATEGDVIIRSKNISLESLDYELADKELKEKALTCQHRRQGCRQHQPERQGCQPEGDGYRQGEPRGQGAGSGRQGAAVGREHVHGREGQKQTAPDGQRSYQPRCCQ